MGRKKTDKIKDISYLQNLLDRFESIDAAREEILNRCRVQSRHEIKELGAWPCTECDGDGKVYNSNDPYEGHKLSDLVQCEKCHGRGIITKVAFQDWYDNRMAPYRAHLADYLDLEAKVDAVLDKLDAAEIDVLKRWFGRE